MTHRLSHLLVAASLVACGDPGRATPSPSASIVISATPPPAPPALKRPSATDAKIAMHNLSGQIDDARSAMQKRPKDLHVRIALFDLLRQRASVLDRGSDLVEAARIAETAVADFPEERDAYLLKARGLAAVHTFRDARLFVEEALLCTAMVQRDAATKAAPPKKAACPAWKGTLEPDQRDLLIANLDAAVGRYAEAEKVLRARVEKNPSSDNLHLHANVLAFMGRDEEAAKRFDEAEAAYRNVSPFPLAEIYADRAAMWQRAGEMTKATRDYEIASLLLPQHVHVATHLAALRAPKEAIALLAPLAETTESADLLGTLGTFEDMQKDGAGDAHLAAAKKRYEELEQLAPEAYADHAAWFWLGVGKDPPRALRLAQKNLAQRETSEAFELALRAATDAGERSVACDVAARARAFAYPSDMLLVYLKQIGDCPAVAPPK